MNFPCPKKVDCDCEDLPIRNFSAEPADKRIFFPEVPYGFPRSFPPLPPGGGFYPDCASDVSQEQANLCAAKPPNNGFPDVVQVFGNQAQTCTVSCPNGSTASYTVAANTFFAFSQADANAMAANLACSAASPSCGEVLFKSSAQSCTVNCSGGGTSSYTADANSFTALAQAEADAQAAAFACQVATQQCSGPVTIIKNSAQTCVVACETGSATYTLPAGSVTGTSQAEADAVAIALACRAAMLLCASVPPLFPNNPQTCEICAGARYTIRAGAFTAATQAEADLLAYLFACSLSKAVCDKTTPPDTVTHQPMFYNTPQTCEAPCPGGIFRYTVYGRTFAGTTLAEANAAAQSFACFKAAESLVCLPAIATTGCINTLYSSSVAVSGASAYSVSGSLPPGVSLFGSSLLGVPSTEGTYSFTVTATFPSGAVVTRLYTVRVAGITGSSVPGGEVGTAYSGSFTQAGMTSPVWSIASGALPPGLALDSSSGAVFGTPTTEGGYTFVVQAADSDGRVCQKTATIIITPHVCPNWATLPWDVPNIIGVGGGATGSMTPSGAPGAVFTIASSVTTFPPDPLLVQGTNFAEFMYTGGGCDCQLEVDFSGVFTNPMEISASMGIRQNGVFILSQPFTFGVNTYPFSLNGTGGVAQLIRVDLTFQCHNLFGGGPCSMNVQGTLSNPP